MQFDRHGFTFCVHFCKKKKCIKVLQTFFFFYLLQNVCSMTRYSLDKHCITEHSPSNLEDAAIQMLPVINKKPQNMTLFIASSVYNILSFVFLNLLNSTLWSF
jgi:hypothetical protein